MTLRLGFGVAATLFCIGICYAIASASLSISPRKDTYRLQAHLCVGAAVILSAFALLLYDSSLPTYEVAGTIEGAQVRTEGRSHRTYLKVLNGSGAEVVMNADGISPYFRAGQFADVRYQGVTGHILYARFLSSAGEKEGVFNGTDTWPPYWWLLGGVLVIAAGFRKKRRDSEGAEKA